jgi:hypothetical protein
MIGKVTWNYRIIMDDTEDDPRDHWYSIHEVYYLDGKPFDHAVSQSTIFGESIDEMIRTMALMKDALNHPILKKSEFPSMDNYRREEWMKVRDISGKLEK